MIPRFSLVFLTMFLTFSANSVAVKNNNAETLLSLLPTHCAFSTDFKQVQTIDNIPKPIISNGTLVFSCKDGLLWHAKKPTTQTHIYRKKTKNTLKHAKIDDAGKVEFLNGRSARHMAKLLNALMGSDTTYMLKHFNISPVTTDNGNHDNKTDQKMINNRLVLIPYNKRFKKFINQIELNKKEDVIEIHIINNETESIKISTSNLINYEKLDQASCINSFSNSASICELFLNGSKTNMHRDGGN